MRCKPAGYTPEAEALARAYGCPPDTAVGLLNPRPGSILDCVRKIGPERVQWGDGWWTLDGKPTVAATLRATVAGGLVR